MWDNADLLELVLAFVDHPKSLLWSLQCGKWNNADLLVFANALKAVVIQEPYFFLVIVYWFRMIQLQSHCDNLGSELAPSSVERHRVHCCMTEIT